MQDQPIVLLTGATGGLGSVTLARILETTEWQVIAAVRAGNDEIAAQRIDEVLAQTLVTHSATARGRVHAIAVDIELERLGLDQWRWWELAHLPTHVIHLAGDVAFDRPLDVARRRNVGGARQILELAANMPGLQRFVHVSTAYVCGDVPGRVYERDRPALGGPRNTYERSKREAEELVGLAELPITIIRPSIVGGSQRSGYSGSAKVFYPALEAVTQGTLPLIRGWASSLLDVVPVDYVAAATIAATVDPAANGLRLHLAAGDQAITLGEFVELASHHLGRRGPRIVPPTTTIEELVSGGELSAENAETVRFVDDIYGPYLKVGTTFDTTVATALLAGHGIDGPARLGTYFDRLVAYAVASEWGRAPISAGDWTRAMWPFASESTL